MAENACLFLTYAELQNVIRKFSHTDPSDKLSLAQLSLAAAGAGGTTSIILTPVELVKCKMQVQMLVAPGTTTQTLPGPISVLMSTVRQTGFRGLWLGHTGTFIREVGGAIAWFGTKEYVASKLMARRGATTPLPWESALSGACAGASFNLAFFPADTVKSAMQTEAELRPSSAKGATFISTFKDMYRAGGVRGLYAGCGVTVARSIPSSALIFLIYDGLNRYFA